MGILNRIFFATSLCLNLFFVEAADCNASQPRSEGPPTSTVLTETDSSGNIVTVTFVQSTVTEFSSLSTTTTITSTSTDNDGALVAIPLILGAGGLVWIPIGGPLPPGVTPPPTPPGSERQHPDQPNSNTNATAATPSISSKYSTRAIPTVDAIVEPPLPNYKEILAIEPEGPLPAEEDSPSPLEAPSTNPHVEL